MRAPERNTQIAQQSRPGGCAPGASYCRAGLIQCPPSFSYAYCSPDGRRLNALPVAAGRVLDDVLLGAIGGMAVELGEWVNGRRGKEAVIDGRWFK